MFYVMPHPLYLCHLTNPIRPYFLAVVLSLLSLQIPYRTQPYNMPSRRTYLYYRYVQKYKNFKKVHLLPRDYPVLNDISRYLLRLGVCEFWTSYITVLRHVTWACHMGMSLGHVTGACHLGMSQGYVTGACHRGMSPGHVIRVCHRGMSPGYVTGACHRGMSPGYVTGACHLGMSLGHVTGACHLDMSLGHVTGACHRGMSQGHVT